MDLIRYFYTHLILRVTDDLSQNMNWRREVQASKITKLFS